MIPNLNELEILQEEKRPWKRMVRPVLALLFLLTLTGGMIWLYTVGIRKAVDEDVKIDRALQAIGQELWTNGTAPEIRLVPPDLAAELIRLKARVVSPLKLLILPATEAGYSGATTHELLFMSQTKQVLAVQVAVDPGQGKVAVLSWRTGPDFTTDAPPRRR